MRKPRAPTSPAGDAIYSPTLNDALEAYESGVNRGFAPERSLRHAAASLAKTDSLSEETAAALLKAAIERQIRARHAPTGAASATRHEQDEG